MMRVFFLGTTACFLLYPTVARAEVDAVEAFRAHAKLMTGGVWVSESKNGDILVDKHISSKSKKFVRIQSVVGDDYFAGVYGIDPSSGDLTLWSFKEDGIVDFWICTEYKEDRWTWEQHTGSPDATASGKAVAIRISNDELKLIMEGEERIEQIWKRKN